VLSFALNQPLPAPMVAFDPGEVNVGPGRVIGFALSVYDGRRVMDAVGTLVSA